MWLGKGIGSVIVLWQLETLLIIDHWFIWSRFLLTGCSLITEILLNGAFNSKQTKGLFTVEFCPLWTRICWSWVGLGLGLSAPYLWVSPNDLHPFEIAETMLVECSILPDSLCRCWLDSVRTVRYNLGVKPHTPNQRPGSIPYIDTLCMNTPNCGMAEISL